MLEALLAGAVAGYAIAIPVGAIAVLIIHSAINHGLRTGLAAASGAASADGIYATVAVVAGGVAASLLAVVEQPLQLVATVVLVGLALRGFVTLRSTRDPAASQTRAARHSARRTYLTFLGLTLVNPVTVVYFAALVVGLPNMGGAAERAAFVVGAFGSSISWQWLLAVFGSVVGHGSNHRLRVASAVVGNLIVLGFGVLIGAQALS